MARGQSPSSAQTSDHGRVATGRPARRSAADREHPLVCDRVGGENGDLPPALDDVFERSQVEIASGAEESGSELALELFAVSAGECCPDSGGCPGWPARALWAGAVGHRGHGTATGWGSGPLAGASASGTAGPSAW
jgi:hypothetical protein